MRYSGILLIGLGAILLVRRMDLVDLTGGTIFWMAVAALGAAKIYPGFTRPAAGGQFWGTMFLGVGLYEVLAGAGSIQLERNLALSLLVVLAGVGAMLKLAGSPREWHIAIPAVALLGLGSVLALAAIGIGSAQEVLNTMSVWGPCILIALGAALLLNAYQVLASLPGAFYLPSALAAMTETQDSAIDKTL